MDKYEDCELWAKYRPTAKEYFKQWFIGKALGVLCITIKNRKNLYSKPYHVELVVPSMNAAFSSMADKDNEGPRKISLENLNKEEYRVFPVSKVNIIKGLAYYEKVKDNTYDHTNILFNQFFNFNIHNKKAEICTEFCAGFIGATRPHKFGILSLIDYVIDREKIIKELLDEKEHI
jgi:hypothetical protein